MISPSTSGPCCSRKNTVVVRTGRSPRVVCAAHQCADISFTTRSVTRTGVVRNGFVVPQSSSARLLLLVDAVRGSSGFPHDPSGLGSSPTRPTFNAGQRLAWCRTRIVGTLYSRGRFARWAATASVVICPLPLVGRVSYSDRRAGLVEADEGVKVNHPAAPVFGDLAVGDPQPDPVRLLQRPE